MFTSLKGCGHVNTVKRIISVILCFAIVIASFVGCLVPRAGAVDAGVIITVLADYLGNLGEGAANYLAAIGADDDDEYQWVADINPMTGQFYIYDMMACGIIVLLIYLGQILQYLIGKNVKLFPHMFAK